MQAIPFRVRGREVSRVEGFSDVVFGFALTLIVISLEVPKDYEALMTALRSFPAFAICFAMLTWIWYVHHTFFRRYALSDEITIALNTVLLFVVMLYIYPLKFIFSIVTGEIQGTAHAGNLFIIYGLGFAGIFALFVLMHMHALRKREELELTALEIHDTYSMMIMYGSYVGIGIVSAIIGAMANTAATMQWAGFIYFALGPVSAGIGYWRGSLRHKRQLAMSEAPAPFSEPLAS
jgi:uncharacterized membrane protein